MNDWKLMYHKYYEKTKSEGKQPLDYFYWIREIMKG